MGFVLALLRLRKASGLDWTLQPCEGFVNPLRAVGAGRNFRHHLRFNCNLGAGRREYRFGVVDRHA